MLKYIEPNSSETKTFPTDLDINNRYPGLLLRSMLKGVSSKVWIQIGNKKPFIFQDNTPLKEYAGL